MNKLLIHSPNQSESQSYALDSQDSRPISHPDSHPISRRISEPYARAGWTYAPEIERESDDDNQKIWHWFQHADSGTTHLAPWTPYAYPTEAELCEQIDRLNAKLARAFTRPNEMIVAYRYAFGRAIIDPINNVAHMFTKLTGNKTIRPIDLELASELGFEIVELNKETKL
jgi:hypothetical protein